MHSTDGNLWQLPFDQPARLELQTERGSLTILPVEPGQPPRLELSHASAEYIGVSVDKLADVVRVSLEPHHSLNWLGGAWECRATAFVPRDVRAAVQTSAGSVAVRGLDGCELTIQANAGKIDLSNVYGYMHLSADAGSVNGRELGGAFDVETHAGSVRLEILDLLAGAHHVRASVGSVRLELARGIDVCIETHTTLGSVRNNYPVRSNAATRLVLATEMGSIRVDEGSMLRAQRRRAAPTPPDQQPSTTGTPAPAGEADELQRILEMVEAGELSARDADELLRAMGRV